MYIITGSLGLVGYSASCFFLKKGKKILGIDNDMRKYFFGENSSNKWKEKELKQNKLYKHLNIDIRNNKKI
jgi:CDP-paratose 2-epimerase